MGIHPGELIDTELIARFGDIWYSVDMASKIGVSVTAFNELVFWHNRPITEIEAQKFGSFLGIKPDVLIKFQKDFDAHLG